MCGAVDGMFGYRTGPVKKESFPNPAIEPVNFPAIALGLID